MKILGSEHTGWELFLSDYDEPACVAENMSYAEAADCFAANHPELAAELDELKEFMGVAAVARPRKERSGGGQGKTRKRGSGARFRELMMAGKTNEECLKIVRAEFAESVATLSDAAWNRALLRKNPTGFRSDGNKA